MRAAQVVAQEHEEPAAWRQALRPRRPAVLADGQCLNLSKFIVDARSDRYLLQDTGPIRAVDDAVPAAGHLVAPVDQRAVAGTEDHLQAIIR